MGSERGHRGFHRVGDLHGVGARLPLDRQHDGAFAVVPTRVAGVLDIVEHPGHVLEAHRSPVLIGDRELAELGSARDGSIGEHRVGALRAPQNARRQVGIPSGHGRGDLIQSDATRGERPRVDLNPDRVFRRAKHLDLRDAVDRRETLREERLGILIEGGERQRVGRQREVENRRVGWIRLVVRGRLNAGGQLAQRFRDRRLHILRSGVDIAREHELQRHIAVAQRARRRHRVESRDRRKLFFQRRGNSGSHRLRACTGQAGGDRDRRKIDVREITHGQQPIRHDPEHENAEHHERRRHRPSNEQS